MRLQSLRTLGNIRGIVLAAAFTVLTVLLVAATQQPVTAAKGAAGPAKCTDVPLEVTIGPIDGGVLIGDSKGTTYKDRVDGVFNTVVHTCSTSLAGDVTMMLSGSGRNMGFLFPAPIAGSVVADPAPAWTGTGSVVLTQPTMHVRNILWGRQNNDLTFTTGMGFSSIKGPGDRSDYRLQFLPMVTDAHIGDPNTNFPYEAASVTVEDSPGTCRTATGGTLDSWTVTVNRTADTTLSEPRPFVGTLRRDVRKGTPVQVGQYDMPFQLFLQAQTCVPASVSNGY